MLHHPFPAESAPSEIAEEIGRARRIFLTLNNPNDLRILEAYIAELEARQQPDRAQPVR